MRAQDMRIGNLFIDAKGRICKVYTVSATEGFKIYAMQGAITTHPIEPIPISEEWLLRAGFEDTAGIKVFINGRYDVERVLSDSEEWGFCIDGLEVGTTIKYVHQLQNLMYSLTGIELEFHPIAK